MKKTNVLYCGMADDVLSPLLLVPDFDTLYSICLFDSAFAMKQSWDGQKEDIKRQLTDGHDDESHHMQVYRHYHTNWPVTKLVEPCKILKEEDKNGKWMLIFSYLGKERSLIYFHHKNFYSEWPSEIQHVNHLMSMGAVFMREKDGSTVKNRKFFKCISERCAKDCLYYELYNDYDEQYGFHSHKKDSRVVNVKHNSDIIINALKYELNKHYQS